MVRVFPAGASAQPVVPVAPEIRHCVFDVGTGLAWPFPAP